MINSPLSMGFEHWSRWAGHGGSHICCRSLEVMDCPKIDQASWKRFAWTQWAGSKPYGCSTEWWGIHGSIFTGRSTMFNPWFSSWFSSTKACVKKPAFAVRYREIPAIFGDIPVVWDIHHPFLDLRLTKSPTRYDGSTPCECILGLCNRWVSSFQPVVQEFIWVGQWFIVILNSYRV